MALFGPGASVQARSDGGYFTVRLQFPAREFNE